MFNPFHCLTCLIKQINKYHTLSKLVEEEIDAQTLEDARQQDEFELYKCVAHEIEDKVIQTREYFSKLSDITLVAERMHGSNANITSR